ncbi:hypothetical protein P167DRAFT_539172 [Morchella conica CCBAS932]|uniref:Dockerin type 1 n=1 Tax=Morchella conica CCBAS932 TaxID=1392247 RepID=A0A3N4KS72_9PEZI|nr:hypothetical protein P167DRAFT_539172 [Morchella conica CCBAS932]
MQANFHTLLWLLTAAASVVFGLSITSATTTTLGIDVEGSARLNGGSFQTSAITSYNGWQYAAFYNTSGTYAQNLVTLGRRKINPVAAWEFIVFKDYVQTTIDGHNTISLGISTGDGTIHLSYDHHDVPLHYRVSQQGVATNPASYTWSTALFGSTLNALPGATGIWTPVTYPRFERVDNDLFFELRIGASGSGDSYIYLYSSSTHSWSQVGRYLQGSDNNAYINGIDYLSGRLQASWTWRETPDVVTNHDLGYAYSDDKGLTWKNNAGTTIASMSAGTAIGPTTSGSIVYTIPQGSGILNQEGQIADAAGRFHVLNRETTSGTYLWYHYWRSATGIWTRNAISISGLGAPTATGLRGKLAIANSGELIALIPSNTNTEVYIYASTVAGSFKDWKLLWTGTGFSTEPLFDKARLKDQNILSVFFRQSGSYPDRKLQVIDFALGS